GIARLLRAGRAHPPRRSRDAGAMIEMGRQARAAASVLRNASAEVRSAAIRAIAGQIRKRGADILAANARDVARATRLVDRLRLDEARLEAIAAAVEQVAALPDP